ncbi:MAG: thioesterase [Alphaproteobacteria bacterium]|nr:thioesterase [Alphaproteobacteria bacterium]|tara:strand:+ start:331 stop:1182 length:852 start_codon:yes stop_codon:yes gene_type:complete
MKYRKTLFSLLAVLFMTACTKATFSVINIPTSLNNKIEVANAVYDQKNNLSLSVYQSKSQIKKPQEVVIFFHGGRWETGSREDYKFIGYKLAEEGFLVVIPDYRKYPDVKFPAFVEDAAQAIAWVDDNIMNTNAFQGESLTVMGHSSGAHIGALALADASYLAKLDKAPSVVDKFIGLAGPYSFTPEADDLKDMFGPAYNYPNMQVTTFIDGFEPHMYLLHGDADETVEAYNYQKLEQAITAKGGKVTVKVYKDIDHTDILKPFTWVGGDAEILNDVKDFVRR